MNTSLLLFKSLSLLILSFTLSIPTASSAHCNKQDRETLLSILTSLGAVPSPNLDPDCCTWSDIDCSPSGRVTGFAFFADDSLVGPIPPQVGDFPYLTQLTFHKLPNLTGPIPRSITRLTKLTFLRLDWNSLSGPVPDFLAQFKSLDYLNLAFNKFSGSIPPSLGTIPLSFIRLDRNRLTGPIPDSLAKSSSQYLYLSHNNLSGPLPKSFSNVTFQVVDLSRNMLSGDGSILFGERKVLQNLDLSRNEFAFDMTKVRLPKGMVDLDVNHNKIYGEMQKDFELRAWQNLNVSYNRLCGRIPSGGNVLRFDEYSFFHNRCLCGPPLPTPCK